jgi:glycosyltransferase involved in cell wall biosynthesis
MEPLVSILIPAFNAQRWVASTIESALGQTWPRKEIVVVDDGSSDQTLAVARAFAGSNVKVMTQPNRGAAAARNQAFSACQGDYIQWLDADDLLAPDKIATQMEGVRRGGSKRRLWSSAWGSFTHRPDRARFVVTALWEDLPRNEWLLRKLGQNLYMQTATWLVSRELTEAAGPWDPELRVDDDGEYFCRVLLASDGVQFVPESKVYYRQPGPGNLSYIGLSNKKLEAQLLSMKLHIGYLRSLEDSERVRAACLTFLRTWLFCFYPERLDLVEELRRLAAELGGGLEAPRLSWKYAWIEKAFGWSAAKRVQFAYNRRKYAWQCWWDRAVCVFERRRTL